MKTKIATPNIKELINANPFESMQDIGEGVARSFTEDLGKQVVTGLWDQMLGIGEYKRGSSSGELREGQEIDLAKHNEKPKQPKADIDPGINYRSEILHTERYAKDATQEIAVTVQEILIEIKRIMSESKELQVTYKTIAIEQHVTKPGKYHVNFFSFFLGMLRKARMQIEDSGNWLAAMQSKKGQKMYWNQFKKHGTSFALSNERNVATQTG